MMNNTTAFPVTRPAGGFIFSEGLTKRELMAAMMLQGILSNPEKSYGIRAAAENAVMATDALILMLAELEPLA